MDDHQLSYMIKKQKKKEKRKKKGWIITNWIWRNLKKQKLPFLQATYIYATYVMFGGKKKPKKYPFLQATYIYTKGIIMFKIAPTSIN
jgi:hypothetical protein